MKSKLLSLSAVALACAALALVSCERPTIGTGSRGKRGHGPPPHAPAHGHRAKHGGVELVYDSGLGVYVVVDFPSHYYCKGSYYRVRGTQWEVSVHIDGPWKSASEGALPPGLRAKAKGKATGKGKPDGPPGRGGGAQKKK